MRSLLRYGAGLLALATATAPAYAVDLITGLGGAAGYGVNQFDDNDDESLLVNLGFNVNFFGNSYNQLWLNNNGNVSFGERVRSWTPQAFGTGYNEAPMIAAFWADIDTRGRGDVYFSSTADRFVATWNDVGYFSSGMDAGNTFQLVLINRNDDPVSAADDGWFDVEFRYSKLEWPGDNGGSGYRPQAGYDVGYLRDGGTGGGDTGGGENGGGEPTAQLAAAAEPAQQEQQSFYALPGSFTADIVNLATTSNTGTDGLWKFQFRDGALADGSSPEAPLDPIQYTDNGFEFGFEVTQPTQPIFIDPFVTTGYRYEVTSGGLLITSAFFSTDTGDLDGYQIYTLGGQLLGSVANLGTFNFASAVSGFLLRGIDPAAGLDPANPYAFVTGLTFNGTGNVTMVMDPDQQVFVPDAVPEPATWAMMLLGFGLVGCVARRRGKALATA